MDENTEKITDKRLANLKPAWKAGDPSPNPYGRPKGQKNYATLRAEAIINIGKANGKTPEQIEVMLHEKGIAEALKGDFRFYKDDIDRMHGKAEDNVNLKGNLIIELAKEIVEKNEIITNDSNTQPSNDSEGQTSI